MKRYIFTLLFPVFSCLLVYAQPFNVKKASKAVLTLKTFKADGTLLASSNAFFVGEEGCALSSFAPFRGADRAVVIDAQGKEWPVEAMLGANETYDVAKFRVDVKKPQGLAVAQQTLSTGSEVWALPYLEVKKVPQGVVRRVEKFLGDNAYYTVALQMPETMGYCPLLNAEGAVVGLMQAPSSAADTLNYAVSACFADSLRITGLSMNDRALRSTNIKKALPAELDQALLAMYIGVQSLDSAAYAVMVDDFIAAFPTSPDGYAYRAQLKVDADDFKGAQQDMEQAISVADKKDEAHYNYARLIYQKEVFKSQLPFEPWSYEKAYQEVGEAYALNAQPIYRHLQAQIRYAQKQYDDAFAIYQELLGSSLRSAEMFFEASRCKEQLKDTTAQLALLDSALAQFSRPLLQEAAPYLLARAQARLDAGKYREATADLNEYEPLMRSRLGANFYYIRYQAEVGGRLFKQALDDIQKAIDLLPQYDLYYAEKASLEVRVGLYDDAIATARQCIDVAPDHSDGYLFLGLAQCLKGEKTEGVKNLQKAKELGDEQADDLIAKYAQ